MYVVSVNILIKNYFWNHFFEMTTEVYIVSVNILI